MKKHLMIVCVIVLSTFIAPVAALAQAQQKEKPP